MFDDEVRTVDDVIDDVIRDVERAVIGLDPDDIELIAAALDEQVDDLFMRAMRMREGKSCQ